MDPDYQRSFGQRGFNRAFSGTPRLLVIGAVVLAVIAIILLAMNHSSTPQQAMNTMATPNSSASTYPPSQNTNPVQGLVGGVNTPVPTPPSKVVVAKNVIAGVSALNPGNVASLFREESFKLFTKSHAAVDGTLPYVTSIKDLQNLVAARGARYHIGRTLQGGDAILQSDVVAEGLISINGTVTPTVDYGQMLGPGEMAAVVTTNSQSGLAQPGDYVDLLVSFKVVDLLPPDVVQWRTAWYQTQALVQGMRVLAVNGQSYVVAVPHQDAIVVKWSKDSNAVIDAYVRSTADGAPRVKYFHTDPVLPPYIFRRGDNHGDKFTQDVSLP